MNKVTSSGKNAGQPLYALTLTAGFTEFNLFRTASQLSQDLKGLHEMEYKFLAGTVVSLPEGSIVEAGTELVNTTTGVITLAKSRQYRMADKLFVSVESWGDNYIDFCASRMDRKVRQQSIVKTEGEEKTTPEIKIAGYNA